MTFIGKFKKANKAITLVLIMSMLCTCILSGCQKKPTDTDDSTTNGNDKDLNITEFNIAEYIKDSSCWATENISSENGGYILDIKIDENADKVIFDFSFTQGAPSSRIAEATMVTTLSDIKSNVIELNYTEDGWGHSGKVKFTFNESNISFAISDVYSSDDMAMWGLIEDESILVKSPEANSALGYDEEYSDNTQEPTNDLSKASGILKQLNMTEQEFRDSCIPLNPSVIHNVLLSDKSTFYFVESRDLLRNPNNYIGQHFILTKNKLKEGAEDWTPSLDELEPYTISGDSRFTNDYGETVYRYGSSNDVTFLIFDMRDDIYNPNITPDSRITPYMIFIGASGGNILKFQMISCDVDYRD